MDENGNPTITDDGLIDASDPHDVFSEPIDYVGNLVNAVRDLERNIPFGQAGVLDAEIARLSRVFEKARRRT
jgi:hypothetical protein